MSRLRIVHRTGFDYDDPATASYNEARMMPFGGEGQFVLQSSLDISPAATQHTYIDYWGTRVSTFEVLTPHTELSVTATSLVEVGAAARVEHPLDWAELAVARERASQFVEQTWQTPFTTVPEDAAGLARELAAEQDDPAVAAFEICRVVGGAMEYMPGVTGVHSTAAEAWSERRGVCQDIAHVTIGALRSVGIPARYVSGYLHPDPSAAVGVTVTGESHAWVEWFTGDWHGYDPTNLIGIADRHVLVGRGRDYADVPPLRGVYAGPSASNLFVSVEITRES
ncbi:transglutaminase family protein [Luethyella okanaganae]|uniref:Transglutaminase N-terminal domain-containing protein n=1 Tax=Luethyella okanaganae TaxID=69372 RepID=A0ABW1VHD2_9MICO